MGLSWKKYTLQFNQPSGTSRGVLRTKDSWFLTYRESESNQPLLGECSIIEGLSPDPVLEIEVKLDELCAAINTNSVDISQFPAIRFGLEMIELKKAQNGKQQSNDFQLEKKGIPINGLIWMGEVDFMKNQIKEKVSAGFTCIKIKIGAIDFNTELDLLHWIRSEYNHQELELRVDANGAFSASDALQKLQQLSKYNLHSIEQPIASNQWEEMAQLCSNSPIPIALDEELIGLNESQLLNMMETINPQYIILKPSLLGGLEMCDKIIEMAEKKKIRWWLTSALESNLGLDTIAQYAYRKNVSMPQGLGTGGLYTNNLDSPLYIQDQFLFMNPKHRWNFNPILT